LTLILIYRGATGAPRPSAASVRQGLAKRVLRFNFGWRSGSPL
jgi:hypothetical protein